MLPRSWAPRSVLILGALSLSVASGRAADVTSTLIGSGSWVDNSVWTSPLFPNNGNGGLTYDAVINSGSVDIPALTQIIIQALALAGGQISGDGSLLLNAASTWSGGTLSGGATGLTLQGGGPLTVTDGGVQKVFNGAVTNAGTLVWQQGSILSTVPGSTFTNTGLIDLRGDGTSFDINQPSTLVNAVGGTLRRSVGTGTATITLPVVNQGTIDVDSGVLSLQGGGTSSGVFDVAAGAILDLTGGVFAFQSGASNTGAGLVRVNGGTIDLNGATNLTNLELAGGVVNVNGAAQLPNLRITGGTLSGGGTLTLIGASEWTSGALSGPTPGMGQLTLSGGGPLTVTGPTEKFLIGAVTNAGTLRWQQGLILTGAPGGTFTNTGLVDLQGDGTSFLLNHPGTLVNAVGGTLRRSVGTGTATITLPVVNQGTIDVDTGVLSLAGGGSSSGVFDVAAGATLDLSDGQFAFQNGVSNTGAGLVRITGATVDLNGATNLTNLELAGGVVNVNGAAQLPNLRITGGTLSGGGTLTLIGASEWTGGVLSGPTPGMGQLTLSGGGPLTVTGPTEKFFTGAVTNAGTLRWQQGAIFTLAPGGTFTNTGLVDLQGDGTSFTFNHPGTVINAVGGTLRRSVGTGTATITLPVVNQGTIDVDTGVLSLAGGGSSSGVFDVAAGAILDLTGGVFAFQSGASNTGAGLVRVNGGTIDLNGATNLTNLELAGGVVNVNGAAQLPNLRITGGTLSGGGTLTLIGASEWTSGALSGPTPGMGQLTLSGGGPLTVTGPTEKFFTGAVTNAGTLRWQQGAIFTLAPGGTFTNTGLVDLQGDGTSFTFNHPGTVINAVGGTLRRSVGTGTATITLPVVNQGTIDVDSGVLSLQGGGTSSGVFDVAAGAILDLTGGVFAFQSGASNTGAGLVRIAGATVDLNGATSFTNLEVAAGAFNANSDVTVSSSLSISGGAINVFQSLGDLTGLSLEGGALTIDANSSLNLAFDAGRRPGALDWAFRWQGDRIAQLLTLLGGRITISGNPQPVSVIYDANRFGDFTYIGFLPRVGDFDGDDDIDVADYLTLSTNFFTDVTGLSTDQAYLLGDVTGDLRIDGKDFADFRTAYDEANGVGAFVAMLATVPEPATIVLAALLTACLVLRPQRVAGRGR